VRIRESRVVHHWVVIDEQLALQQGTVLVDLPAHQATDIKARCTPKYAGDIHLIKTQPHMHARGVRLDTIVERANGSRETLIDVPYDFTNQITYETDMVLWLRPVTFRTTPTA
jgi:hypothetical protein